MTPIPTGPEASVSGTISGGANDDTLELRSFSDPDPRTFDLSDTTEFETVRLQEGNFASAWILEGTAAFTGLTEVLDGAILQVDVPTVFGGDLNFSEMAGLLLTLDGSGTPPITVQGNAAFDGQIIIDVDPRDLTTDTSYRVIDVLGSYTGEFGAVQFNAASAAFGFTESYDADGLAVFFESLGLAGLAQGGSQIALANYLTAIDTEEGATADLQTLIDGLNSETDSAANVFSALLPEAYDVHTTISAESGRRLTQFLFDRPRECEPDELNRWLSADAKIPCHARTWSPWVSAIGSLRNRDGFAGHPGYDAQMGGVVLGFDTKPLAGIDFTFALATQSGTINVDGAGESDLTIIDLTGQAAWNYGPLRTQGAVTWGHGFHDGSRDVRFQDPGVGISTRTSRSGDADFESDRVTLSAEMGLLLKAGPINVEPLASVDWTWINQEEIKEGGNVGGLGIQIEERDEEIASVSGGVRLSTTYEQSEYVAQQLEWMDGVWRPQIDFRWRQILSGYDRSIRSRLRGAPDTAGSFSIDGKEDKGGFEIGAGLSFTPEYADRLQIDLQYQAFVASHTLDQDLIARVTFGF